MAACGVLHGLCPFQNVYLAIVKCEKILVYIGLYQPKKVELSPHLSPPQRGGGTATAVGEENKRKPTCWRGSLLSPTLSGFNNPKGCFSAIFSFDKLILQVLSALARGSPHRFAVPRTRLRVAPHGEGKERDAVIYRALQSPKKNGKVPHDSRGPRTPRKDSWALHSMLRITR